MPSSQAIERQFYPGAQEIQAAAAAACQAGRPEGFAPSAVKPFEGLF